MTQFNNTPANRSAVKIAALKLKVSVENVTRAAHEANHPNLDKIVKCKERIMWLFIDLMTADAYSNIHALATEANMLVGLTGGGCGDDRTSLINMSKMTHRVAVQVR